MKKLQKRVKFNDPISVVWACSCMGSCTCGMTASVYTQATAIRQDYAWIR